MISLEQVAYTYPGTTTPALRELSFTIPEGQFCGVVGPNGAGKSSLALALAGFIPHFYHGSLSGMVRVNGKLTAETPLHELVRSCGLVFQNPFNQISGTKFSVREEIAFGLENLGVPRQEMLARVEAVMQLIDIADLAERSPVALSGGQMQRVALASVLVMRPRVLVLDEPTAQLDPLGSREVFTAIRRLAEHEKMTVVMIEHKLEWLAAFSDRIIALVEGRLAADGLPGEVLTDESLARLGVGQTRYTQAARLGRQAGYWPPARRLAVTLEEAVEGFQAGA